MKNTIRPFSVINGEKFWTGTEFITNEGEKAKVLKYINGSGKALIEFENGNFSKIVQTGDIYSKRINNPYHPNKYHGFIGFGDYDRSSFIYKIWYAMLRRCENEISYTNTYVCNEWLNFQNFANWYTLYINTLNPDLFNQYEIDKDIFQLDNFIKFYSPDTCCIVPFKINDLFIGFKNNSKLPIGVAQNGTNFQAAISINNKRITYGNYSSPMEAFNVYKFKKEEIIKEIAINYFQINAIRKEVYEKLMSINIKPFYN